jgi:hypothetical protein
MEFPSIYFRLIHIYKLLYRYVTLAFCIETKSFCCGSNISIFRNIMLCNFADIYLRFERICSLHLPGRQGSKKVSPKNSSKVTKHNGVTFHGTLFLILTKRPILLYISIAYKQGTATGRSLIRRKLTECLRVCFCVLSQIKRHWPEQGFCATGKKMPVN